MRVRYRRYGSPARFLGFEWNSEETAVANGFAQGVLTRAIDAHRFVGTPEERRKRTLDVGLCAMLPGEPGCPWKGPSCSRNAMTSACPCRKCPPFRGNRLSRRRSFVHPAACKP